MNNEFIKARKDLFCHFEKGVNVVLSTSLNDVVTSRTVTIIAFKDALYLTSIKRPGAMKIAQIEKNPNVSICLNTMQITGESSIIGLASDEQNEEIMSVYKSNLPESYKRFEKIPGFVLIKIELLTCKDWKMVGSQIESSYIDFTSKTITKNII